MSGGEATLAAIVRDLARWHDGRDFWPPYVGMLGGPSIAAAPLSGKMVERALRRAGFGESVPGRPGLWRLTPAGLAAVDAARAAAKGHAEGAAPAAAAAPGGRGAQGAPQVAAGGRRDVR